MLQLFKPTFLYLYPITQTIEAEVLPLLQLPLIQYIGIDAQHKISMETFIHYA